MLDARVFAVGLLVLLAGCGGAVQEAPSTATTETTTPVETVATTGTATAAPPTTTAGGTPTTAETPTATPEADVENPWGKRNVTVAVRNSVNQSRDIKPLVERTLAYWNGNGSEYAAYDVTFVPATDDRDADVVVELVARITECDGDDTDTAVGCAPVLDARSTPDDPTRVRVVAGYSNESTVHILKHEFGHVLGIEHGEEPMPTMEPFTSLTYLSQTDLSDRRLPWRNSTLSVHVDVSALPGHDREDAREQVRRALEYYASGAGGAVPDNVSFARTSNRSAADVRIRVPDDPFDCAGERVREGSCGNSWVYYTDTDDAPEYFAAYEIRLRGLDEDAIAWHVGFWLADALGLGEGELPDPFVDADYDDRRSEWWE